MLLSNMTSSAAVCSGLLDLKIPILKGTDGKSFYPPVSRCPTSPLPENLPGKAVEVEEHALPLLLEAFVQGATRTSDGQDSRKAPLHFLSSVFANLSTV